MQLRRGVHFTNQLFYSPQAQVNFVDMSLFDDLEWDMTLVQEVRLMRLFNALKLNWQHAKKSNTALAAEESDSEVAEVVAADLTQPRPSLERTNSLQMLQLVRTKTGEQKRDSGPGDGDTSNNLRSTVEMV